MKGNTMKKYELIESDKVTPRGMPLFQVVALRDFGLVKTGDKGGYIESEANLSHNGDCWVYGNAWVGDTAQVCDTARVSDNARVSGTAWVYGTARVSGDARVSGTAEVDGNALVFDDAWVYDNARVYGTAWVYGTAQVCDNARVSDNARVYDDAWVYGTAWVYDNARIFRDTQITAGYAFATKNDHWDITEVDNGNGTSTLYADAVFEPVELKPCHGGQTGKFCSECGEKL